MATIQNNKDRCSIVIPMRRVARPELSSLLAKALIRNLCRTDSTRGLVRFPSIDAATSEISTAGSESRCSSKPIELGGGSVLKTWVVGPGTVPEVTEEEQALASPELAVLSAMSYRCDADAEKATRIAAAAQKAILTLDDDRQRLYFLLIEASLSEAARQESGTMDLSKLISEYESRSEFVRRYRAEGRAEGMLAVVSKQLERRFGALPDDTRAQIAAASPSQLDAIAEKLLTAESLEEALSAQ